MYSKSCERLPNECEARGLNCTSATDDNEVDQKLKWQEVEWLVEDHKLTEDVLIAVPIVSRLEDGPMCWCLCLQRRSWFPRW